MILSFWVQTAAYLDVGVVLGDIEEGGQAFAEPHGDFSFHVDAERFKAFLQTTHGVVLKGAGVLPQVHAADLSHAKATHGDETWKRHTLLADTGEETEVRAVCRKDGFLILLTLYRVLPTVNSGTNSSVIIFPSNTKSATVMVEQFTPPLCG